MIEIKDISKSFGKLDLLNKLNYLFEEKGITAIVGPNGSGKTTLLKLILGLYFPDNGSIMLEGVKLNGNWRLKKDISYLPQKASFPENLKVKELIEMLCDLRGMEENDKDLAEEFGIEELRNKKIRTLSGGQKQRVNIYLAFMFPAKLYILDEPTVGLDPITLYKLKNTIRKVVGQGKRVIFTSHLISLVEQMADDLVFLLDGKIEYHGTAKGLIDKQDSDDLEHAIAGIMIEMTKSA